MSLIKCVQRWQSDVLVIHATESSLVDRLALISTLLDSQFLLERLTDALSDKASELQCRPQDFRGGGHLLLMGGWHTGIGNPNRRCSAVKLQRSQCAGLSRRHLAHGERQADCQSFCPVYSIIGIARMIQLRRDRGALPALQCSESACFHIHPRPMWPNSLQFCCVLPFLQFLQKKKLKCFWHLHQRNQAHGCPPPPCLLVGLRLHADSYPGGPDVASQYLARCVAPSAGSFVFLWSSNLAVSTQTP